jgi:hypothetical protein
MLAAEDEVEVWVLKPETEGMWGGGSAVDAEVVRDERGWSEAGVETRRSE